MNNDLDTAIKMHADMVKAGNCRCDPETGVGCELCFTWGVLTRLKREIDRLRSENAALTAERDHARQDAATVRLQLAETQRPFTVTVEIPELLNGECNMNCPFSGKYIQRCGMKWDVSGEDRPGPGCQRYQKPDSVDTDT